VCGPLYQFTEELEMGVVGMTRHPLKRHSPTQHLRLVRNGISVTKFTPQSICHNSFNPIPCMFHSQRIPPTAASGLGHNPFASLPTDGLPLAPKIPSPVPHPHPHPHPHPPHPGTKQIHPAPQIPGPRRHHPRKKPAAAARPSPSHRLRGIGLPEKERLAKSIQRACGTGRHR